MKYLSLLLTLASLPIIANGNDFIQQWNQAESLQKSGDSQLAFEARMRCFESAVEARNTNYAYPAAARAVFNLYRRGETIEAGKLAHRLLETLKTLPPDDSHHAKSNRTDILIILDRGLHNQGRIGDAWRVNGTIAATLRGQHLGPDEGGEPLSVAEILSLPKNLRSLGWRCLTRHAEYLNLTGQPIAALDLLAEASEASRKHWHQLDSTEAFYVFKLGNVLSRQLDDIGYTRQALELEKELLALPTEGPSENSKMMVKINHLRNLSQWQGPSQEILAEAQKIGAQASALSPINANGIERLLAKMELDLNASERALESLAQIVARQESAGEFFEAIYSARDSIAARSRNGENIPDSEFHQLLSKIRAQGNKRGEPSIYIDFANHLVRTQRTTEAIPHYREALRLVRSFKLDFHEIQILSRLLEAQLDRGDPLALQAALDELNAAIARIQDLPPEHLVRTAIPRAQALLALGRASQARQIIAQARKLGHQLPAHQMLPIQKDVVDALFAHPVVLGDGNAESPPILLFQPEKITTLAIPGEPTLARFTLINRSLDPASSSITAQGPGAEIRNGELHFDPAKPNRKATLKIELAAGGEKTIETHTSPATDGTTLDAQLQSQNSSSGLWEVQWNAAAKNSVVLDASQIRGDPFRSISFSHQVQLPAGIEAAAFRLVSPEPLRIEYYDSRSGHLIAVDANGNGNFSEDGDLHLRGPDGTAAAWITPESGSFIDLRLFGSHQDGAATFSGPLTLMTEVHRDGIWTLQAENILR